MKLRKINRGIVLGCVLAVATAGYVVYDNVQFSKNKDAISSTVEDYLTQLAETRCSTKDQEKLADSYADIINKYWINDSTLMNELMYTPTKSEMLLYLDTAVEDCKPTGYFTDYDINIQKIKVKKYGPNGAIATVNYQTSNEFYGTPLDINGWGVTTVDNENYDSNGNYNTDPSIKYEQTGTYEDAEIYIKQVDGEWKIYGDAGYCYMYNTHQLTDNESADAEKGGDGNE